MGRKRNVITTKKTSTQEKLDKVEASIIFELGKVWITHGAADLLSELCGNQETKEEAEERVVAVFWHRYIDDKSGIRNIHWKYLLDGTEWTKNARIVAEKSNKVELSPIIGRDDLDGWIKVVKAGKGISTVMGDPDAFEDAAKIMVIEGIVRYLRQADGDCKRMEEFCDTLIETGLLGSGGLSAILRQWSTILQKARRDEYSDTSDLPRSKEDHTALLVHFASAWLPLLGALSEKLHSVDRTEEAEQIRILAEKNKFVAGLRDGVSDYALHLWCLFKEKDIEQLAKVLEVEISLAWWSDNEGLSGLMFLKNLYEEVSQLFRVEAEQFCTEAECGNICERFERLFKSKNEKCLHGRYLVAMLSLLTSAGRGSAGGIGFYSEFEGCVRGWTTDLGRYRRDLQDISYLQREVVLAIQSAWSEGGPLWPYKQTWSHIRRNGLDQPADELDFRAGF